MIYNFDKEIFEGFPFRWYSLAFAFGFFAGSKLIMHFYKKEGNQNYQKITDTFFVYAVFGTLLGARLGHVFFYQWDYYSNNLFEILKVWKGGLASHGGAIGLIIAILIFYKFYSKIYNFSLFGFLDKIIIATLFISCLIRLGNFANSEIIGNPTDSKFGIIFVEDFKDYIKKSEGFDISFNSNGSHILINFKTLTHFSIPKNIPFDGLKEFNFVNSVVKDKHISYTIKAKPILRHPSQLYESTYYFLLFIISLVFYEKLKIKSGLIFGIFIFLIFIFRFFIEFIKESQVAVEETMVLNIGQLLSIPFILFGIYLICTLSTQQKTT
jgi:phosphatidylglycerol:prolipoprotein diacylglycerol transferase